MVYLNRYISFIFDCDGVVLNSNKVKTEAFYQTTRSYGEGYAEALVRYHVQNGGVSRYKKFEYFIVNILKQEIDRDEMNHLLGAFSKNVKSGLMECEIADGLDEFRYITADSRWCIVSGGDQEELREIFVERKIDYLFDGGIFGSPETKETILAREISSGNIKKPGLFIGDSKYDYQAADGADLDFIFLSKWSEFKNYKSFFMDKDIDVATDIKNILSMRRGI